MVPSLSDLIQDWLGTQLDLKMWTIKNTTIVHNSDNSLAIGIESDYVVIVKTNNLAHEYAGNPDFRRLLGQKIGVKLYAANPEFFSKLKEILSAPPN